jgi:hypothetical protein
MENGIGLVCGIRKRDKKCIEGFFWKRWKEPLERPRCRRKDNMKTDFKGIRLESIDLIDQDKDG